LIIAEHQNIIRGVPEDKAICPGVVYPGALGETALALRQQSECVVISSGLATTPGRSTWLDNVHYRCYE